MVFATVRLQTDELLINLTQDKNISERHRFERTANASFLIFFCQRSNFLIQFFADTRTQRRKKMKECFLPPQKRQSFHTKTLPKFYL